MRRKQDTKYNLSFLINEPKTDPEIELRRELIEEFKERLHEIVERKSGTCPLLKVGGCPSYLVIEWELFNSVVFAKRGEGLSVMIDYGLDVILKFPEIVKLDKAITKIRSAPASTLDIRAKSILYRLIGTSAKPGLVIYPAAMTGLENLTIRIDQTVLGRLTHWSQRIGMNRSALAAMAIGQALVYFSICDPESRASVYRDENELRAIAESWHFQISSLSNPLFARANQLNASAI
jgi:hypothetical protein